MVAVIESNWVAGGDEHVDPEMTTSALLIIDTQADFVDGGASPISGTTAILPALAALRTAFLRAGRPVVHVVRLYQGEDVDRVRRTAIAGGARIVAPDSAGAQVVPELRALDVATPDARRLLAGELEDFRTVLAPPSMTAAHTITGYSFPPTRCPGSPRCIWTSWARSASCTPTRPPSPPHWTSCRRGRGAAGWPQAVAL